MVNRPGQFVSLAVAVALLASSHLARGAEAIPRPNILWLTCEDTGPQLGCYGDKYADTPRLDALAAKGTIYTNCWSNAPVCAPARTTLISGLYPTSTGAEHMRSMTQLPAGFLMYPQYLRQAGYYCTNNNKEDYNLEKPGIVWDDSSGKAHWKNRSAGQPFFAVFNFTNTHESQVRTRPHQAVHDPAKVRLPAYHPDAPEVRQDWAQYYDNVTEMDQLAGKRLDELQAADLEAETIVFFYGDHGPGMPRSKRWPFNSGLHVPLIVYVPPKYQSLVSQDYGAGRRSDRLVAFVDFAPTLLSLAGIKPPEHFQGHAYLGEYATPEQPYLFGFRGRMDERTDLVRSVRDKRYVYIRNYMPHLIYGQHVSYMFETPTTQVWKRLFDEGKLSDEQSHFWRRKPSEELYDLQSDPDEVHNLAGLPQHKEILDRMRQAQRDWILRVRDVGLLPEHQIHARSVGSTPYEMGHDAACYPLENILKAAECASQLDLQAIAQRMEYLSSDDAGVRYWGVLGLTMRGEQAVSKAAEKLTQLLDDPDPCVRVATAHAFASFGPQDELERSLQVLLAAADAQRNGPYVAVQALNAIDALGARAASLHEAIGRLPVQDPDAPARANGYANRLVTTILSGAAAGATTKNTKKSKNKAPD